MMREIRGATRLVAVLGHPIAHSLSPVMHNAAYEVMGLDWAYVPLDAPDEDAFSMAVSTMRATGFIGFNVTMPYKRLAYDLCDELRDSALAAGAVNTVQCVDGRLVGHNTDGAGLVEALSVESGVDVADKSIVVLGAGGAAAAAVAGLLRGGARQVTIAARRELVAVEMATSLEAEFGGGRVLGIALAHARAPVEAADVVVNATPLGMRHGDESPVPGEWLSRNTLCYDMVYGTRHEPAFQIAAQGAGCRYRDGLGMLVAQAALAIEIWTGSARDSVPRDVMKQAAARALAGSKREGSE